MYSVASSFLNYSPWCQGTIVALFFGVFVLRFHTGDVAMSGPISCSMTFNNLSFAHRSRKAWNQKTNPWISHPQVSYFIWLKAKLYSSRRRDEFCKIAFQKLLWNFEELSIILKVCQWGLRLLVIHKWLIFINWICLKKNLQQIFQEFLLRQIWYNFFKYQSAIIDVLR